MKRSDEDETDFRVVRYHLSHFVLSLGLLLIASPAFAGKTDIHVDFDRNFDFKTITSYAWKDDPKQSLSQDNPYLNDRIVEVVDARFYRAGIKKMKGAAPAGGSAGGGAAAGATPAGEKASGISALPGAPVAAEGTPDIYVAYRVSTTTDLSLDSGFFGYGYPLGWFWDPYWNSVWATPNMPSAGRTYTKGTLLIEAWTAQDRKLIWRGAATGAVSENYEKMYDKIFKVVGQIADRWRDMREEQEKEKAKAASAR